MEAVQDSDALASLEERITRAVQVITSLRDENNQLQQQLNATRQELNSTKVELNEAQKLSADVQRQNSELEQRVQSTTEELDGLRGERKQVKTRIEKLLSQLDLLSAS